MTSTIGFCADQWLNAVASAPGASQKSPSRGPDGFHADLASEAQHGVDEVIDANRF